MSVSTQNGVVQTFQVQIFSRFSNFNGSRPKGHQPMFSTSRSLNCVKSKVNGSQSKSFCVDQRSNDQFRMFLVG